MKFFNESSRALEGAVSQFLDRNETGFILALMMLVAFGCWMMADEN